MRSHAQRQVLVRLVRSTVFVGRMLRLHRPGRWLVVLVSGGRCRRRLHVAASCSNDRLSPTTARVEPQELICLRMRFEAKVFPDGDRHQRHLQVAPAPSHGAIVRVLLRRLFDERLRRRANVIDRHVSLPSCSSGRALSRSVPVIAPTATSVRRALATPESCATSREGGRV